jgi:TetR/AcrR family transcriptional regulator
MAQNKVRISGAERRDQIIQATIDTMAEHGIPGTTTKRIAERVGISEPGLYKYFPGKKELVLKALEEVGNKPLLILSEVGEEQDSVPERIMKLSATFYEFVMDNPEDAILMFEAITGSRDPDIKAALSGRFIDFTRIISGMFEKGKEQGSVREDLDTTVAAWQILALGITLVLAALMDLGKVLTREKALLAVEEVLGNIVSNASAGE